MHQYSALDKLRELTNEYFNPKSCLHHYLHMAEGNYREYLQKDLVRTKKYFYVLRPVLACDWIKQTNTMVPMEFDTLVESQVTNDQVKQEIQNLLSRKIAGEELREEPKIGILNNFLDEKIRFYNDFVKSLQISVHPHTSKLNALFRQTMHEAWGD